MTNLPRGWAVASLDDIAEINPRHPRDLEDSLPITFVRMSALSETAPHFQFTEERELREVRKGFTHFAEGDVLFAKITPCMENGKAAVASHLLNGLGCGTTELHVLRPRDGITAEFIYYFSHQESFREEAARNFTGTAGQLRVPIDFMRDAQIPLPPVKEQRRIVAKLEKLLSRVDATQARLATIPRILKRFRQSVIDSACSGRLTEDWRLEQVNSDSTTTRNALKDVARFIDYRGKTPRKTSTGVPLITAKNIRPGYLSPEPREYIAKTAYDVWMTRGIPKVGDVLITTEAPLGYVVCVDWKFKFALAQRVICLQFDRAVAVGQYASLVLQSTEFQRDLLEQATGSMVTGIKASRLKGLSITFPSIAEQKEIVRRVEALFKTADALEARYRKAKAHVDKLTQSILAKAFRGELVPQNPNDEPASLLLERIRHERNGAPIKRARKKSRK